MNNKFCINEFIIYCENTTDDEWCLNVVRDNSGKNCLFGHLFKFAGDDKLGNYFWDYFEANYATTYMVYPINDGSNKNYQQDTPKARCLAYLKNLRDGIEKTTIQIMDDYDKI